MFGIKKKHKEIEEAGRKITHVSKSDTLVSNKIKVIGFDVSFHTFNENVDLNSKGKINLDKKEKKAYISILSDDINSVYQIGLLINYLIVEISKKLLVIRQKSKHLKIVKKASMETIKQDGLNDIINILPNLYQLIYNAQQDNVATKATLEFANNISRLLAKINQSGNGENLLKLYLILLKESRKMALYLVQIIKTVKLIDKKINVGAGLLNECNSCKEYYISGTICPYCIISINK